MKGEEGLLLLGGGGGGKSRCIENSAPLTCGYISLAGRRAMKETCGDEVTFTPKVKFLF